MAEIQSQTGNSRKRTGVRRSKKLSTTVDLTPMVDLGFLLITFFIITTTWSEAKAMRFIMPKDGPDMPLPLSVALTLIPMGDDKVFFYHGEAPVITNPLSYGETGYDVQTGIGEEIRKKQLQLSKSNRFTAKDLMLIIKPADESSYKNLVNIMDEVLINDVSHYAVSTLTIEEKELIRNLR